MFLVQWNENKTNCAGLEDFVSKEKKLILVTMDLDPKAKPGGKLKKVGTVPAYFGFPAESTGSAPAEAVAIWEKIRQFFFTGTT